MGYRSDVAFRIEVEKCPEITALHVLDILKERLKVENELNILNDTKIQFNVDKTILTLRFEFVKWYACFKSVQIVEKWYADICNAIRTEYKSYNDDGEVELSLMMAEAFAETTVVENKTFSHVIGAQRVRLGEEYDDINNHIIGDLSTPIYISRMMDF